MQLTGSGILTGLRETTKRHRSRSDIGGCRVSLLERRGLTAYHYCQYPSTVVSTYATVRAGFLSILAV